MLIACLEKLSCLSVHPYHPGTLAMQSAISHQPSAISLSLALHRGGQSSIVHRQSSLNNSLTRSFLKNECLITQSTIQNQPACPRFYRGSLVLHRENPQFLIRLPKTNTIFAPHMQPLAGEMAAKPPAMAVESIRIFFDTRFECRL
jgi:hypothetical protein